MNVRWIGWAGIAAGFLAAPVADAQIVSPRVAPRDERVKVATPAISIAAPTMKPFNMYDCMGSWSAMITNDSSDEPGSSAQAQVLANGQVVGGAGGWNVYVPKGETREASAAFEYGKWGSVPPTHYRVLLHQRYPDGRPEKLLATSPLVPLPTPPPLADSFAVVTKSVSGTGYGIALANKLTSGYPGNDLELITSVSASASGPWVANAKKAPLGCVKGSGESSLVTGTKSLTDRFVKIEVSRGYYNAAHTFVGGVKVLESIVDLSPPAQTKAGIGDRVAPTLRK